MPNPLSLIRTISIVYTYSYEFFNLLFHGISLDLDEKVEFRINFYFISYYHFIAYVFSFYTLFQYMRLGIQTISKTYSSFS